MSQPVCIITIFVLVFHHNPLHTVAALPRQKLTSSQEELEKQTTAQS